MARHHYALLALAALLLISGCSRSKDRKINELNQRVRYLKIENQNLQAWSKHLNNQLQKEIVTASTLRNQVKILHQRGTSDTETRVELLHGGRTGIWDVKWPDDQIEWRPVLLKQYDPEKTTPTMLEQAFNQHFPKGSYPGIKLTRITDGIAFVRLLDPDMLTERMGTTGAGLHTFAIVLTLTSLPDVDHVYLYGFEQGSHMGPCCLSRADIADWQL